MLRMKRRRLKVRPYSTRCRRDRCIGHSRSAACVAADAEAAAKEGKEDYKGDSKFSSHLKTNKGVSNFAKTRTLKEQREYLPAFACREELMKTIRENQGWCSPDRN